MYLIDMWIHERSGSCVGVYNPQDTKTQLTCLYERAEHIAVKTIVKAIDSTHIFQ
jgi:hypothetical protein